MHNTVPHPINGIVDKNLSHLRVAHVKRGEQLTPRPRVYEATSAVA